MLPTPAWLIGAEPDRNADAFRVDFGIDLARIPVVKAASVLRGRAARIAGADVIIAGHAPPAGTGLRVPRYGELTRPQFTALAAETLALGRTLRTVPVGLSGIVLNCQQNNKVIGLSPPITFDWTSVGLTCKPAAGSQSAHCG